MNFFFYTNVLPLLSLTSSATQLACDRPVVKKRLSFSFFNSCHKQGRGITKFVTDAMRV